MYVCIRIIIYSIGYFMGINLRYWIYIIIDIYILLFNRLCMRWICSTIFICLYFTNIS